MPYQECENDFKFIFFIITILICICDQSRLFLLLNKKNYLHLAILLGRQNIVPSLFDVCCIFIRVWAFATTVVRDEQPCTRFWPFLVTKQKDASVYRTQSIIVLNGYICVHGRTVFWLVSMPVCKEGFLWLSLTEWAYLCASMCMYACAYLHVLCVCACRHVKGRSNEKVY